MRECLISRTCLAIAFWSDFIDLFVEDQLLSQVNSKRITEPIKPNLDKCYLIEDFDCDFANLDKDALPKNSVECLKKVAYLKNFETYHCCKN